MKKVKLKAYHPEDDNYCFEEVDSRVFFIKTSVGLSFHALVYNRFYPEEDSQISDYDQTIYGVMGSSKDLIDSDGLDMSDYSVEVVGEKGLVATAPMFQSEHLGVPTYDVDMSRMEKFSADLIEKLTADIKNRALEAHPSHVSLPKGSINASIPVRRTFDPNAMIRSEDWDMYGHQP